MAVEHETELGALHTFGQFLQSLEDGQLHGELSDQLRTIAEGLCNYQMEHGGSPKGSLSLTINFVLDRGVFEIAAKVATKLPDAPRSKSVLWVTPGNVFTPANPKQMQLFKGPRVLSDEEPARRVDPDSRRA